MNQKMEPQTDFGRISLSLDRMFSEMHRLSEQMQSTDHSTDYGLERSVKLLNQFVQCGQGVSGLVTRYSEAFQEARMLSEKAAQAVSLRAIEIQKRREEQNQLQERFSMLSAKVQGLNDAITQYRESMSNLSQDQVPENVLNFDKTLEAFIAEVESIKADATKARLKGIGRNAESLRGTLKSARTKLVTAIKPFRSLDS